MKIKWEAKHNPENALDFWGWQGFADGQGYWAEDGQGAQCQRDHDAFIERIAVANGYIKLEPGQVIVDVDVAKAAIKLLRAMQLEMNDMATEMEGIGVYQRGTIDNDGLCCADALKAALEAKDED